MAVTIEYKNEVLKKLIEMPEATWRSLDPNDHKKQEAIKYIIREDQVPGYCVEFNTHYSRVRKLRKYPLMTQWVGIAFPDQYGMPPGRMQKVFSMNVRFKREL